MLLNSLPAEILVQVFSLLELRHVARTACLVCKAWHQASNHSFLWTRPGAFKRWTNLTPRQLATLLHQPRFRGLESIVLDWETMSEEVYEALAHHVQSAEHNNKRATTVGLWSLKLTAQAVLSALRNLDHVNVPHVAV